MTKQTEKKLAAYRVSTDEQGKKGTIRLGKTALFKQYLENHSVFDLIISTLRFIRVRTWVMQFVVLMLSGLSMFLHLQNGSSFQTIMNSFMLLLLFSIIFFLDELYKSFTSGMWELEQTLKYDLRQHTIVKLLIFGSIDIILILGVSILSNALLATSLIRVILYLLVPFNVFTILILSTLTHWRNNQTQGFLWFMAGIVGTISFVITNVYNVYSFDVKYWVFALVITSMLVVFVITSQLKHLKGAVQ